jgi:hypothetical protein
VRIEALAVELRPRSMPEAADLGVRLAQAHAASVWPASLPAFLAVLAVALASVDLAAWAPVAVLFWLKPWWDRTLLFALSRAVFGQATGPGDVWRDRRTVWMGQLVSTLTLRRLSPWRSYTQAIGQLEGLRGTALRIRRRVMLNGQRGQAAAMQFVFANIELALALGWIALAGWFTPEGHRRGLLDWLSGDSTAASVTMSLIYAANVLLLEPFFVAAGFAMYLNRRVQLEAWDVERELRRALQERTVSDDEQVAGDD